MCMRKERGMNNEIRQILRTDIARRIHVNHVMCMYAIVTFWNILHVHMYIVPMRRWMAQTGPLKFRDSEIKCTHTPCSTAQRIGALAHFIFAIFCSFIHAISIARYVCVCVLPWHGIFLCMCTVLENYLQQRIKMRAIIIHKSYCAFQSASFSFLCVAGAQSRLPHHRWGERSLAHHHSHHRTPPQPSSSFHLFWYSFAHMVFQFVVVWPHIGTFYMFWRRHSLSLCLFFQIHE